VARADGILIPHLRKALFVVSHFCGTSQVRHLILKLKMFNRTLLCKINLAILMSLHVNFSYGQLIKRFALVNSSDNEIKVVTSPIITFKGNFKALMDSALIAPANKSDTGFWKVTRYYDFIRLNCKVLRHDINNPDTGIYLLQPKSALILAYSNLDTKQIELKDISINYLKFNTPSETIIANNEKEIWNLKDNQKFKFHKNVTLLFARRLFTYSIYVQ
jgi:hypothetical protein